MVVMACMVVARAMVVDHGVFVCGGGGGSRVLVVAACQL